MRKPVTIILAMIMTVCGWIMPLSARGQAVDVTMSLGTNTLVVGQTTTLHVFAQVLPEFRADSERIFSWYVDVLNTNGAAAIAKFDMMLKPDSDKDPLISSIGVSEGANRRGIYDTFLNKPGAGTSDAVELMSIPVTGLAPGVTRFLVREGSGLPLSEDFIVHPLNGGAYLSGGIYTSAEVELEVVPASTGLEFTINVTTSHLGGGTNQFTITWPVVAGYDYYVEYVDQLGGSWQTFPSGPHNSGIYHDITTVPKRFYRVRAVAMGGLSPFKIEIERSSQAGQLLLRYPIQAGYNYVVEFRDSLQLSDWQELPGGPYNSGTVTVLNAPQRRFFRVRAEAQ